MSEKTNAGEDLWKFKRYLHTGFETLEKLKTGDDLKDLKSLISLIKTNHGLDAVETIRKISTEGNLNDRTYLIISLAVTARQNFDLKTKTRAYEILKDVCVQPYHLFMFLSKCELFGFLLLHNGELQSQESFKKIDLEKKNEQVRIGSAKNAKAQRVPSAKIESHSSVKALTDQTMLVNSSIYKSEQLARVSSAKKEEEFKKNLSVDKSEHSKNEISSIIIQNNTDSNQQVIRILSGKKEENKLSIDTKLPINERISSAHKNDQITRILSGNTTDRIRSGNTTDRIQSGNTTDRIRSGKATNQMANIKNTKETSKNELTLPLIPLNTLYANNKLEENKIEQEIKLPSIVNSEKSDSDQTHHSRSGFLSPTNPQIVSLAKPCLNTGWGRAHKKAINKWYECLKPLEFAFFLTKYPKKFKWRHRDVFRLSHFKSNNVIHNLLIIYANRGFQATTVFYENTKESDKYEHIIKNKKSKKEIKIIYDINSEVRQSLTTTFEYLKAFEEIKFLKDVNELIELVKKFDFDVEQIFSQNKLALNSNEAISELWIFYLKNNKVSLAQILRNLTNFGKRGIINGVLEDLLCQKIKDQTLIAKENFHPLFLFTLFKIYSRGGNSIRKFAVSSNVSASLYEIFLSSFKSIEILDKPLAICLNTWILSKASLYKNTLVTPFQASVIMLLCSLNSQPNAKLYSLTDKMEEIFIDKNMDFNAIVNKLWQSSIGSTNFTLPILSASEKNLNFDSLVIYTNLEPDINQTHATLKALENYRSKIKNPQARFLYVSMAASSGQIADPNDENMLDLIGFTQNSPQIILNFLKGLF